MGWIFGGEMCYNPKNRMMLPKKGGEIKRRKLIGVLQTKVNS